jgi:hypothetical protein
MKTIRTTIYLFFCFASINSCVKPGEMAATTPEQVTDSKSNLSARTGGLVWPLSNDVLLMLVTSGSGGFVRVSSTCTSCQADTLGLVEFPAYTPPVNSEGILSFATMNDYDLFIKATTLMEDWWKYSREDYEDTPSEIYHLGEESLNALDSALAFRSLRHKYELNEFYNYNWADTAAIYVDDDDYQIVLNENNEFKAGDKFYKFISNNIIAVVSNSNLQALDLVRKFDIVATHVDIRYYNEETGLYEDPGKPDGPTGTAGCADFSMITNVNNLTPLSSTANQWEVELKTSVFYNYPSSQGNINFSPVTATYSVNWGDGTSTNFSGTFITVNRIRHTYSQTLMPGTSAIKNIVVNCQLIFPQTSSGALNILLSACPELIGRMFATTSPITLTTPAIEDCMSGSIKRKFYAAQLVVGGKEYRLFCKIKQKSAPGIGFANVVATEVFEKKKTGGWKKSKPISKLFLNLRGKIYRENTCSDLFKTLNHSKSTSSKSKLKIRDSNVPPAYRSRRSLPLAIQGDFIWTYNNGQNVVGVYNEVIKP